MGKSGQGRRVTGSFKAERRVAFSVFIIPAYEGTSLILCELIIFTSWIPPSSPPPSFCKLGTFKGHPLKDKNIFIPMLGKQSAESGAVHPSWNSPAAEQCLGQGCVLSWAAASDDWLGQKPKSKSLASSSSLGKFPKPPCHKMSLGSQLMSS